METRKKLKKKARQNLKKHYPIFMVACVIAAFIGSEFISSLSVTKLKTLPESIAIEKTKVDKAVQDALNGSVEESKKETNQLKEEIIKKDEENKTKILGRSRGVFAMIINGLSTGSIYVTFITGMNSIIKHIIPSLNGMIIV